MEVTGVFINGAVEVVSVSRRFKISVRQLAMVSIGILIVFFWLWAVYLGLWGCYVSGCAVFWTKMKASKGCWCSAWWFAWLLVLVQVVHSGGVLGCISLRCEVYGWEFHRADSVLGVFRGFKWAAKCLVSLAKMVMVGSVLDGAYAWMLLRSFDQGLVMMGWSACFERP
ncbi:unnamed protein product [Amaranthus hypochondriacus]